MAGFVDEAALCAIGGTGGAGAVSFRREAHVPRGGPDGGDGGTGGDVWLVADPEVASLSAFRDHPHRRAGKGTHGKGKARHGAGGDDLRVLVPEGTVVKDAEGRVLADLVGAGDSYLAARGGRGGQGNARFLSNRRRAPAFAEQAEVAEERWLRLELKLMADVALVGFPNAGKSTLISSISAARPKIADYPFTTLEPHLGVVRIDETELVVADIPGLIEGASEGRGLGHQFLRHVERARVLVVLVDLVSVDGMAPADQEATLLTELGRYRPELLERPRVVVGTKVDAVVDAANWDGMRISAVTGEGLPVLLHRMAALVSEARAARPAHDAFVVHRPEPEGVRVERGDDGAYVVRGAPAERAVSVSDLSSAEALAFVHERLERAGVDRALARAGAREGDEVRIGTMSFEYRAGGGLDAEPGRRRTSAARKRGRGGAGAGPGSASRSRADAEPPRSEGRSGRSSRH
ncbi:MAG: GTPase ObgE [Actinomycetota bacterium]|nr:GTPase ObgE [Actinomycetota bacterium]